MQIGKAAFGGTDRNVGVTESFNECLSLVEWKVPTANGISWYGGKGSNKCTRAQLQCKGLTMPCSSS